MFPLEITSFQQSPHELSDVHHVVAYRLVHRGIVNAVVIKVIVVHVMQMAVHDNVVVVSVFHDVMRVISTQDVHKLLLVVAMAVRVIAISRGSTPHALKTNGYATVVGAGSVFTSFISTSVLMVRKLLMWNWQLKVEHPRNETPTMKK